ncbi:hypothetical protein D9M68_479330 [compost metagenome]
MWYVSIRCAISSRFPGFSFRLALVIMYSGFFLNMDVLRVNEHSLAKSEPIFPDSSM